jgi:hypothetical protein
MLEGLDHVQLAIPRRRFGLTDGRQVHLGVEEPFQPSGKAHPAFVCAALDGLALRLGEGSYAVGRGSGAAA